jgi:hypothetical protein
VILGGDLFAKLSQNGKPAVSDDVKNELTVKCPRVTKLIGSAIPIPTTNGTKSKIG